jgi:hypothetical protein
MRLDLSQASVETIYVTIWASPNVSLHLGKIENADEIWRNHVGVRLQVKFFYPNGIQLLSVSHISPSPRGKKGERIALLIGSMLLIWCQVQVALIGANGIFGSFFMS